MFNEFVNEEQNQFLAHIIRSKTDDPISIVDEDSFPMGQGGKRRVGRPRLNWTWQTYEQLAFKNHIIPSHDNFCDRSEDVIKRVARLAIDRTILT